MNQECSITTPNTPNIEELEENTFEEPADACLRRELDLRPAFYSDDADARKAGHPDQRPCPSWCWVGQHDEYGHEIDYTRPMEASHTMEGTPRVVASLYQGDRPRVSNDRFIRTATLEPFLEQVGQADPVVNVAFRRYEGDEQRYDHEFLRLSVTDARELVTALEYLIVAADRG